MTLGFYLQGHPITLYEDELAAIVSTPLNRISAGSAVIAGYIEAIRTRPGRRGRTAEICLDDRTARLYATLYSETYQEYRNMLHKDRLVIAVGEAVEDDYYDVGFAFKVDRLYALDEIRAACGELILSLHEEGMKAGLLDGIKALLLEHQGGSRPVRMHYIRNGVTADITPGQSWRVDINDKLLEDMRNLLGRDNVSIDYRDVRRFLHSAPRLKRASGIN